MPANATIRYRFGDIEVDLAAARVRKGGTAVDLEPLTFRVLVYLIEHRDRVVPKDDLVDAIWQVKFISDNALTRQVACLRAALGDDARHPTYIETAHALGYRFIAAVEEIETPPRAAATNRSWRAWAVAAACGLVAGALLLIALSMKRLPPPGAGPPPSMRQLTSDATLELYPALSPDGTVLAYTSDRSGGFEVYLRTLSGDGNEVQLTHDGGNGEAVWSPDGQHLAYYSQSRGGIWVIPVLGGPARRLTESGSHPSWSPDGRWIAYQSAGGFVVTEDTRAAQPPGTLWLVAPDGGEPRRLTEPGLPPGGHASPRWSPDGRHLVFSAQDVGRQGVIWALSVADGRLERLSPEDRVMLEGVFSRDGRAVITADGEDISRSLWRIPWLPDRGVAGGPPERLATVRARLLEPLPDGRRMAFSQFDRRANIWEVPVNPGTGAARGPTRPLTRDTAVRNSKPRFSPDGSTIAYFSLLPGNPSTIRLLGEDGSSRNPVPRLLGGSQGSLSPAMASLSWFPDGRALTVLVSDQSTTSLARLDLDTGTVAPLRPLERGWQYVEPSPDGSLIAFHCASSGAPNVWVAPAEGGPARQITFERELVGYPRWSPDGRWLAVELQRGDDVELAVVPSNGGELRQLTSACAQAWTGGWSPDGRFVSFICYTGGSSNLYTAELATGTVRKLTDFTSRNQNVRSPDWSPLGDRIVFEHRTIGADLWLIELP